MTEFLCKLCGWHGTEDLLTPKYDWLTSEATHVCPDCGGEVIEMEQNAAGVGRRGSDVPTSGLLGGKE